VKKLVLSQETVRYLTVGPDQGFSDPETFPTASKFNPCSRGATCPTDGTC